MDTWPPSKPSHLDALIGYVEQLRSRKPEYDWQPVIEEQRYLERRLKPVPPPQFTRPVGDVDEARQMIRGALQDYLNTAFPTEMLLIRCSPGTGKTTLAVEAADLLASTGRRIAYAGPRHDLYLDVVAKSGDPSNWYEWLPRQADDPQTCRYAGQIQTWLERGYQAMDFCSGVCGWDYVKACPYHLQKGRPEPVIYIQHQHISSGHPVRFDVLFGDESPIQSFAHEWRIPAQWVMPPGMDVSEPLTEILHWLSFWCSQSRPVFGPELIEYLGGAENVIRACENFSLPADKIQADTAIHRPEESGSKPYFHLFDLVPLLLREARSAQAGRAGPHRIIAAGGTLTLLLRREPNHKTLPAHIIWMDGTARPEIYQAIFHRPLKVIDASPRLHGRIFQVVDRANGKTSLKKADKRQQTQALVQRIIQRYGYQQPSVISYKDFIEDEDFGAEARTAHFYAARGTNSHEDADAVIIVGAPQPNIYDLVKLAKMIYFERDDAFAVTWCMREVVYDYVDADGLGRSYPVSGYWKDPDLQAILQTLREDEILQAAHRGRPVNHATDIWLLTNVPVTGLPPDQLLTMREVMGAPQGVNIFKWGSLQDWLEGRDSVTASELVEQLEINYETAQRYLKLIAEQPGWELAAIKSKRGKATRQVTRTP